MGLVDGSLREIDGLGFQAERPERLFVLRQVLPKDVPKRLGLLRAQIHGAMVLDRHLVRCVTGSEAEDKLEIPNTDANLHTVGVDLAVIGRLRNIKLRLWGWIHGSPRLLCQAWENENSSCGGSRQL